MRDFLVQVPFYQWCCLFAVIGLCVGSFLNVVIYRLPQMICDVSYTGNLYHPRSYCPSCCQSLPWYCTVPVISYLWLRGQCYACCAQIDRRYLLVEITSACLAVVLLAYFGLSMTTLCLMIFSWIMLALCLIDMQHCLLPDVLTIPLLWLGLLVNTQHVFAPLNEAVFGAVFGYGVIWLLRSIYFIWRDKEGIGLGDAKLCAAIGAWVGVIEVPIVIAIASISALLFTVCGVSLGRINKNAPIPFGPFLIIVSFMVLLFFSVSPLNYIAT